MYVEIVFKQYNNTYLSNKTKQFLMCHGLVGGNWYINAPMR